MLRCKNPQRVPITSCNPTGSCIRKKEPAYNPTGSCIRKKEPAYNPTGSCIRKKEPATGSCIRKNRKGQVGVTISWVIATIVIIGVLIIFIYISILMSKVKMINIGNLEISGSEKKTELLAEKTSLAHQLANNRNKELIDNLLREK